MFDRNPTFRPVYYPGEGMPGDDLIDQGKRLPLSDRIKKADLGG